ncbi:aspartyl/asparaginyl beta-hydroxylase-like isoform X1 [Suncus etruscus]|uniref:aspartyl/asparaginyl beta-hydroxylase-like isoform X1 n=1 Tax=Suncus etruscus TaxID=109475 RepID=UPI002110C0BA|nr:aspartyl/asparaginyl beta-hydroxylase-like isoform X1 [Suncus etruscus]
MAPRKNAKGGPGHNSSSGSSSSQGSGNSSGGGSSNSSSSSSRSGSRRETKHGGHKNGRKGGISGSSFFTWFMVIALLGVWTSVAVVWFELVDYEEVLAKAKDFRYNLSEVLQGKLGVYDADGDGDFDVEDAKVLLGLKERLASEPTDPPEEAELYPWLDEPIPESKEPQNIEVHDKEDEVQESIQSHLHETAPTEHGEDLLQEEDELTREMEPEDNFIRESIPDDTFEIPESEPFYEAEISYHVDDDTATLDYNQDMDEVIYEQENPDVGEPLGTYDERKYRSEDTVIYQDYDDQAMPLPPEEEKEVPPDT